MTSGDLTGCHDSLTEPCLFSYFICSGATGIACKKEHRLTNLSLSPTRPRLSRCGFKTEEPNRGSRSEPSTRCSLWVWCQATGPCWEACTSSHLGWLDSTTLSPCLTSPTFPPCTPAIQAQPASAPILVCPLRPPLSASMTTGMAPWGETSPPPCYHWPPCSLWTPPLPGAKM